MSALYNSGHDDDEDNSTDSTLALTVATSTLTVNNEKQEVQDDGWVISFLNGQFPPEHMEWLKYFEKRPESTLRKSYRVGNLLSEVDNSAPIIRVGITFMAGGDGHTVAGAEWSQASAEKAAQKSAEWRVFTAATLLKRFVVEDDFSIKQSDDSPNILAANKDRKRQSLGLRPIEHTSTTRGHLSKPHPDERETQSVVPRNLQDHPLTIDSDEVVLFHGDIEDGHDFDIICTLIEIDLFSMRDLMTNYRTIVQGGQRNLSAKEIIPILDTMINDVRRLCTRSPRLFRMSTRSQIANSTSTRYGVDYGSLFVTLTTSEGIRKLVEKSSSYFLSPALNDSKEAQEEIRPKFLQMLVLLLSFLNNEDLAKVSGRLESTFHIPGDRPNLELLIMKVLPLTAIDSQVFLAGLFEAYYQPSDRKEDNFGLRFQHTVWESFQFELARKGYIVPTLTDPFWFHHSNH